MNAVIIEFMQLMWIRYRYLCYCMHWMMMT